MNRDRVITFRDWDVAGRRGETFEVEYLYYVLLVLALLAGCVFALMIPGRRRLANRPDQLADRANRHREKQQQQTNANRPDLAHRHAVLERERKHVPTPWGWPGSDLQAPASTSQGMEGSFEIVRHGALRRWVDHLVAEKRTVQDEGYVRRREASLRALLEDRYGRSVQPSEMAYRKVKPPLLRDPSLPYDQLDNFPSGKTDEIVSGLDRQPDAPAGKRETKLRKTGSLKEVKTPWGW